MYSSSSTRLCCVRESDGVQHVVDGHRCATGRFGGFLDCRGCVTVVMRDESTASVPSGSVLRMS